MSIESVRRVFQWDSLLDRLKYEEILGVPEDAPIEVCRQAYYRFAQAFHPDVHTEADPPLRAALTRVFQRGAEAYRVLTDPALRSRWTIAKRNGALRISATVRSPEVDLLEELRDLHPHCRSAGAKLSAQQAFSAFSKDDLQACVGRLRAALEYEGGANPYVTRCLEALELRSLG